MCLCFCDQLEGGKKKICCFNSFNAPKDANFLVDIVLIQSGHDSFGGKNDRIELLWRFESNNTCCEVSKVVAQKN